MKQEIQPTFEEAKEATYSLFEKRCGELLQDFLSEKKKVVCSLCSKSCTEIERTQRALQGLIESLVIEATKVSDDKVDIFICALCPYLSTLALFKRYSRAKTAKRLAREMERGKDRLLTIIRSANERQN